MLKFNQPKAKPIQIKLTEQIQQLVNEFQKVKTPLNDYLLPIVTIEHKDEKLYTHIVNKRKRYGNYLKDLATDLNLSLTLQVM